MQKRRSLAALLDQERHGQRSDHEIHNRTRDIAAAAPAVRSRGDDGAHAALLRALCSWRIHLPLVSGGVDSQIYPSSPMRFEVFRRAPSAPNALRIWLTWTQSASRRPIASPHTATARSSGNTGSS